MNFDFRHRELCVFISLPDGLDNQDLCKGHSILLQKIEDSDLIVMKGKTDRDNSPFRECTIKFSPSSKAKKRTTMMVFESYHIYDCGIYLAVQESPSEFFDKEVSKVVCIPVNDYS